MTIEATAFHLGTFEITARELKAGAGGWNPLRGANRE
jgi:hypothetical protein